MIGIIERRLEVIGLCEVIVDVGCYGGRAMAMDA